MGWLIGHLPWWVIVLAGVAAVLAAWRLLGTRGALAALAAGTGVMLYRWGRGQGAEGALEDQRQADKDAVDEYNRVRRETGRMSDHDLDAANDPWVRDDKRRD